MKAGTKTFNDMRCQTHEDNEIYIISSQQCNHTGITTSQISLIKLVHITLNQAKGVGIV